MSSKTSTENDININYLDKDGTKLLSKKTSDTDYYFDMMVNEDKILKQEKSDSTEDILINSSESKKSSSSKSDTSRSSRSSSSNSTSKNTPSKPIYEHLNFENNRTETRRTENKIPFASSTTTASLTAGEIRMKKIELLRKLSEIKSKGYSLSKEYDFNSSIEDMEYEYALLISFVNKKNGVSLFRNCLLNGVSILEFLNDKYDPFDFKLSGWTDHVNVQISTFDDILEELYEKYKGTGASLPVEAKLLLLLMASGSAFHFSKSQLGNIPGMGNLTSGVLGNMMNNKKNNKFMTSQEMNLENQKKILKEREQQLRNQQNSIKQQQSFNQPQQSFNQPQSQPQQQSFNQPQQSFNPQQLQQSFNQPSQQQSFNPQQQQLNQPTFNQPQIPQFNGATRNTSIDIRAPDNVQDILNRIKTIQQQSSLNTTETQDETTSNNDRLVSDSTINDKKGKKGKKKSIISIDT
jgi:hypothetical protein